MRQRDLRAKASGETPRKIGSPSGLLAVIDGDKNSANPDRAWRLVSYAKHRASRPPEDAFGDAAQEEAVEAPSAVGAYDDDVGAPVVCSGDDLLNWMADTKHTIDPPAFRHFADGVAGQELLSLTN